MRTAAKPTPTLGQDMGYQRDFQLWEIARKAAPQDADASNYRTIAACELQDRNAELVAALEALRDVSALRTGSERDLRERMLTINAQTRAALAKAGS